MTTKGKQLDSIIRNRFVSTFPGCFVLFCFVAVVSFPLHVVEAKCVELNDVNSTNICATLLPYQFAYVDDDVCPSLVNSLVSSRLSPSLWASITPPSCQKLVATLMCAQTYPPCSLGRVLPCSDMCAPLLSACGPSYPLLQQTFGFNCSNTSSSSPSSPSPTSATTTVSTSSSQTCSLFNLTSSSTPVAQCVKYHDPLVGGKFCASVFNADYQVFVPSNSTVASMETSLYNIDFVFRIMPHSCAMQLATFLCEATLPSCTTVSTSVGRVPLPSPPCQSECFALQNECVAGFAVLAASTFADVRALGQALQPSPGCNSSGHYAWSAASCGANATLDFPAQTKLYATLPAGQSMSVTCNSGQTIPISRMSLDSVHCQAPLVDSTNFDTNILQGSCSMPCPSLEMTSDEWLATDSITAVLSTLSTFLSAFLVVTWCVFPSKRQQHYNLFMFISVFALHFVGWVSILATNGRLSLIACRSNTQNCAWGDNTGNCALCSAQAFVSVFGMLSLTAWWTVIAVELTSKIFLSRWLAGKVDMWFQRLLLGFGILFPLCFGLPPLFLGQYSADPPLQFCFINDEGLKNTYFWIPLLTCGALVTLLMMAVIVKICRSSHSLAIHKKQPHWWMRLVRPILFIFTFYYYVVLYVFLDYYNKAKADDFANSSMNFVICLLVTPSANCGAAPAQRPSVVVNYFSTATTSSLGCLVFCVFGLTRENWHLWKGLLMRGSVDGSGGTHTGGNKSDNSGSGEHATAATHGDKQRHSGTITSSSNRDRDGTTTTTKSTPIQHHSRKTIIERGRVSGATGVTRGHTSMNTSTSNMNAAHIEIVERDVVSPATASGGVSPAGVGAGGRLLQRQRTCSIPSTPVLVQLNLHSSNSSFTPTPMLRTLLGTSKIMGGGGERGSSSSSATVDAPTHATTTAAAPFSSSTPGTSSSAVDTGVPAIVEDEVVEDGAGSHTLLSSPTTVSPPNTADMPTTPTIMTTAAPTAPTALIASHHPNAAMTMRRTTTTSTSTPRTAGLAGAAVAAAGTTMTPTSTSTPTITTARGSTRMSGEMTVTTGLLTNMDVTEITSPYGASSSSASAVSSPPAVLSPFSPLSPSAPSSTVALTRHLI